MKNGIYGYAGIVADRTLKDGVIDNFEEVKELLAGIPEGAKLLDLLSKFALVIEVTDITALTAKQLNALRAGDIVNKSDTTGLHAYRVSYKSATGLCLTYADCENVETVAYEKSGDTWAYDSTDISKFAIVIEVTDITALTAKQLDALRAGDIVNKSDVTGLHAYRVSYKSATGLCLTYADCENVETVAYEKSGDTWAYDSTDVTHIAG